MLFISVKPEYARKIIDGNKKVEFRRQKPRSVAGDWIAIYATQPEMNVVGFAQVEAVTIQPPSSLWRQVQDFAGIPKVTFDDYLGDLENAVGILLTNPMKLPKPISLEKLRTQWPGFHPPQAFRYLNSRQVSFLTRSIQQPHRENLRAKSA